MGKEKSFFFYVVKILVNLLQRNKNLVLVLLSLLSSKHTSTNLKTFRGLKSHVSTTPGSVGLGVVVKHSHASLSNLLKFLLITRLNTSQAHTSGSLLINKLSKTTLVLDDTVGDTHLLAESRKVHDELDRIHIAGDSDQLSSLSLNEMNDMRKTILNAERFLVRSNILSSLFVLLNCIAKKKGKSKECRRRELTTSPNDFPFFAGSVFTIEISSSTNVLMGHRLENCVTNSLCLNI